MSPRAAEDPEPVAASGDEGSGTPQDGVAPSGPRRRRLTIFIALLVLAVVNGLWFRGFSFHTWMGDDLYAWALYNGHPSFHDLFLTASGGKYRPVAAAVQWLLFQVFPSSFPVWTYANVALDFLIACLVFWLILRVARGDVVIAFVGALAFVTSRFAYYNVLQVMGTMEAVGLLLLVVILHVTVTYLQSDHRWPAFALAGLYLLISLTHERYLVLFPFLVLLAVLKTRTRWRSRGLLIALFCVPPVLNVVLKKAVFATSFMMGTGGQAIGFQPVEIAKFLVKGGANMAWFNWGPDYLSGITMSETGPLARVVVGVVVVVVAACAVSTLMRVVRSHDAGERRAELRGFVLWAVLVLSLLLVASITIRQEYRWLYAPFVVCLVYFCYQYARLPWRRTVRYVVLVGLCVCVVGLDHYYRQHEGNVFFFYGERIAESAREATMGVYGEGMKDKTVYLEKSPEVDWIVGHDLLLSPYLGLDHRKVVWVESFDAIDPATLDREKSVLLRLDWAHLRMVDVTGEILRQ